MSYPQQYGGYHGSPPPHGHSPQPGYGYGPPPGPYAPPQGQYPPQQHPGYGTPPPQGRYAPPSPQPPQGQYGAPAPQGYPPQRMQQHSPYPQGPYPPPPPPPQPGYGPPPGQQTPQQPHHGAPAGQPAPPSPGYVPGQMAMGDASRDADALRKAMKGLGTDDPVLINILSKPDPLQMELLKDTYTRRIRRNLEKDVASETSGYYRQCLLALLQGPLMHDVTCVNGAVKGLGTKEAVLDDVLLCRSNSDMHAIKQAYMKKYGKSMESDVGDDLSLLTKELFKMVMAGRRAEESAPVIPQAIDADVQELRTATEGNVDQMKVCLILTSRSSGQIRAINEGFRRRFHTQFGEVIERKFSGHMRDALSTIWGRAVDQVMFDAVALEECMKGAGTKDERLVQRMVRIHWDRQHMEQVKRAYHHKYKRDLRERVRGDTSGDYQKLLLAILG